MLDPQFQGRGCALLSSQILRRSINPVLSGSQKRADIDWLMISTKSRQSPEPHSDSPQTAGEILHTDYIM